MTKPKKDLTPILRSLFSDLEFKALLKKHKITDSETKTMFSSLTGESLVKIPKADLKAKSPAVSTSGLKVDTLVAHIDGASRGNNIKGAVGSLAGAGAFITTPDGVIIKEAKKFLGSMTNNGAEYSSLLLALNEALTLGATELKIIADSELMVKQMNGIYKVKSPNIKDLYLEALKLSKKFKKFSIKHTLRENNKDADRLANSAIDKRDA